MEKSTKKIVFTGGGTTGHVTKNKVVMEALRKDHSDLQFHYLGIPTGKEAELIPPELATFHPISAGKLRRYFSLQIVPDAFRFMSGILKAFRLMGKIRPQLVFSSGGYVALPVALAAWLRKIPIITHETDSYPGLANRMIGKLATKILLGLESAAPYFHPSKTEITGNPVSPALFEGSRDRALKKLGFSPEKKTILVMGGSQGAKQINELLWEILPELIKDGFQVIHLTGSGKSRVNQPSTFYRSFEYVTDDYPDFLTAADVIISRAGGNSLAEIAALGKPAIIIPLPLPAAAGDHQRKNAFEMQKKHPEWVLMEKPTAETLLKTIHELMEKNLTTQPDSASSKVIDPIVEILMGDISPD